MGRGFLWQDGVPRGAYRGTVQVAINGGRSRVFITPAPDFHPTVEPGFGVDLNGGATPDTSFYIPYSDCLASGC